MGPGWQPRSSTTFSVTKTLSEGNSTRRFTREAVSSSSLLTRRERNKLISHLAPRAIRLD